MKYPQWSRQTVGGDLSPLAAVPTLAADITGASAYLSVPGMISPVSARIRTRRGEERPTGIRGAKCRIFAINIREYAWPGGRNSSLERESPPYSLGIRARFKLRRYSR